jgi:hypothetical protein
VSDLTAEQLEGLLNQAHEVVVWTTQDTIRRDAAGVQHLYRARRDYLKARIDAYAAVRPLTIREFGGCTCDPHTPDLVNCLYHYAAALQPDNHRIPWNCPTYYDGCNCTGKS